MSDIKRITLEPAYVLHRRAYRESSFLIELLSKEHGRLSVIAKGMRKSKTAQGLLQPFVPLLVSLSGKNELLTLSQVETNGEIFLLRGECLFAGLYLNELLMYLLQKGDPHPALFTLYDDTVRLLQADHLQQKVLRAFEKKLLEELGYALLPKADVSLTSTILADKYYRFIPEQGLVMSEIGDYVQTNPNVFLGKDLLAIAREEWEDEACLQAAKRLTRFILTPLLGAKRIYSRQLFMQLEKENK